MMFGGRLSERLNLHDSFLRMHRDNLADDKTMRLVDYLVGSTLSSPDRAEWRHQSKHFFLGNNDYVDEPLSTGFEDTAWSDWASDYTATDR
jgi:hypothetical protein